MAEISPPYVLTRLRNCSLGYGMRARDLKHKGWLEEPAPQDTTLNSGYRRDHSLYRGEYIWRQALPVVFPAFH